MRIIFFGTPDFAVPSLSTLVEAGEEVVAIVTQPDRVKGRGHKLSMPPVKEYAVSRGIPVLQPETVRSELFFDELSLLKPEVIAVVAYGKIIPPRILSLPPLGCVNVHASLLPKYRGAAPIQWSLIRGETRTGITSMLMNEGLDTGDILLKEETAIAASDNAYTLALRLAEMGAPLLYKTLCGMRDRLIVPVPQTGEPSYAPPLRKDGGEIDWRIPAEEIFNLVRGTYPWPGASCSIHGERIVVIKAGVPVPDQAGDPGKIINVEGPCVLVATGRGALPLHEVKPVGKKTMSASAFMHGRRFKEGASFDLT